MIKSQIYAGLKITMSSSLIVGFGACSATTAPPLDDYKESQVRDYFLDRFPGEGRDAAGAEFKDIIIRLTTNSPGAQPVSIRFPDKVRLPSFVAWPIVGTYGYPNAMTEYTASAEGLSALKAIAIGSMSNSPPAYIIPRGKIHMLQFKSGSLKPVQTPCPMEVQAYSAKLVSTQGNFQGTEFTVNACMAEIDMRGSESKIAFMILSFESVRAPA